MPGRPAEGSRGGGGVGDQAGRVAGAARADPDRDGAAGDPLGGGEDLAHAVARAAAEVVGLELAGDEAGEGGEVDRAEVRDVDVVAHAGAVLGRVVVAEDLDPGAEARGGLEDEGDEVGLGDVLLAELAGGVRAGGVEEAQDHRRDPVGARIVAEDLLHHQLGAGVAVDGELRHSLDQRHRVAGAVGGAGGGEDDLPDPGGAHRVEDGDAARHVVAVVEVGPDGGFAHIAARREMEDGLDPVPAHHLGEGHGVVDVAVLERAPLHRPQVARGEVVVDDALVPGPGQRLRGMGADIAGTAGDQDFHGLSDGPAHRRRGTGRAPGPLVPVSRRAVMRARIAAVMRGSVPGRRCAARPPRGYMAPADGSVHSGRAAGLAEWRRLD